jgi:hypothetical protein
MACSFAHALMFGSLREHGLMYCAETNEHHERKSSSTCRPMQHLHLLI